jgi:hypothetical protein
MLIFRDENDHQILRFETEESPDKEYLYTKVYDENDKLIDEFEHKELKDRVYFYKGYISNKNK